MADQDRGTQHPTLRLLSCVIFGEVITVPWPRDRMASPEPVELCDIEVDRARVRLFVPLRIGNRTLREMFCEIPCGSSLWHECWDMKFRYPSDVTLTGVIGLHAFYLLRLYEVGADSGASLAWRRALENGSASWRALENLRPDLASVPLLARWKANRAIHREPINPRGRQQGTKAGDREQFAFDLVAISERENAARLGRPITWEEAVHNACERFPELLRGGHSGMPKHFQKEFIERMVDRVGVKQRPQARLRKIREQNGLPPVSTPKK